MLPVSSKAESMKSYFFALLCGMSYFTALAPGRADTVQASGAKSETRYVVYWLTRTDSKSQYRMLLITRMPLPDLAKLMKLHGELENVLKDAPASQLLDWPAL